MSFINCLPAEVLTMILKEVQWKQGMKGFSSRTMETCVLWRNLAASSCFWQAVDDFNIPLYTILYLSKKRSLSNTESIFLNSTELKGRNLELLFHHCPTLQNLRLSSNYCRRLLEILPGRCTLISRLMLVSLERRLQAHMFYGYFHRGCPNLVYIALVGRGLGNARSLLEQVADSCPNLRFLCIHSSLRSKTMVFPITRLQRGCPLLETIQLPLFAFTFDENADNNGFPELMYFSCAYSVSQDGFSGITDSELASLLRTSTKLAYLDARQTSISIQCLCELPASLMRMIMLDRILTLPEYLTLRNHFGSRVSIS